MGCHCPAERNETNKVAAREPRDVRGVVVKLVILELLPAEIYVPSL